MSLTARLATSSAAIALAAGGAVLAAPGASAAGCTSTSGVLVVVDFGNGQVRSGCVTTDPARLPRPRAASVTASWRPSYPITVLTGPKASTSWTAST